MSAFDYPPEVADRCIWLLVFCGGVVAVVVSLTT